jgi:long-chain acyl-CoA synthetase
VGEDLQRRQRRARRRPDRKAQFDDGVNAAIEIRAGEPRRHFTDEQQATLDFLDSVAFSTCAGSSASTPSSWRSPVPPRSRPVIEWFNAIGVPLAEIYGMSETTAR